jgi:hypothetical protein
MMQVKFLLYNSRKIFIIFLLSFWVKVSNSQVLEPLNKNSPCIEVVLYFDIDNTSHSYFNNIIRVLGEFKKMYSDEINTVNIVLPSYVFENAIEKKEFLNRITVNKKEWRLNLILFDSLYNALPYPKGLAKYLVFNNKIPIAFGTCKWDNPFENERYYHCNNSNILIDFNRIEKVNIRNKVFTDNNITQVLPNSDIIIIDDYFNKTYHFEYQKNEKILIKELDLLKFNALDYYCNHIAESIEDCKIANSYKSNLKSIAKNEKFITSSTLSENGDLFFGVNYFAHYKSKETKYFINDIGIKDSIPKGNILANQLSLIAKVDKNMKVENIFSVKDDSIYNSKGLKHIAGIDYGFYIDNNNTMFCYMTPFEAIEEDEKLEYCIGRFVLDKNLVYTFDRFVELSFPEDFHIRETFNAVFKLKKINGSFVYSFGTYDFFYVNGEKVYIDKIRDKTTLKPENLGSNLAKNEQLYCNYYILDYDKDVNSNNIIVFYRVDNQFVIEVFDEELKSIAFYVISNTDMFPDNANLVELISFSLTNNILSFNYRDKKDIFLSRYKIDVK